MSWNTQRLDVELANNPSPVIAYVGAGLDPLADLLPHTLIVEARSFVALPVGAREATMSAAALRGLASAFAGRWGPHGTSWCRVVAARVTDVDGNIIPEALTRALAWLRLVSPTVVATTAHGVDLYPVRPGIQRACAGHQLRLGLLADLTEADFRPPLRLVA